MHTADSCSMVVGQGMEQLSSGGAPRPGGGQGATGPVPLTREACFASTLDASGDGYSVLRAVHEGESIVDWVVIDANAPVRERWAPVVGDVIGIRVSTLNAAADNWSITELYQRALVTQERQELDFEVALPAGNGGWRRTVVVPVDERTITVVTHDITRERYFESLLEDERRASRSIAEGAKRSPAPGDASTADVRITSRSASALLLGASVVTIANSLLSRLPGVNVPLLRVTAAIAAMVGLLIPFLPWQRHSRFVAGSLVVGMIGFLPLSDQFNHYSRSESAVAVYPVFFIMIVAWSGLTQVRGAASLAACLSGFALAFTLAAGGHSSIGWQCAIVTMPGAAVLGEVLSWSHVRASNLARRESERRLHDSLTGLANRQLFTERLDQALARVRRHERAAAVLFIDLDRFKRVNDTLGHTAGDQLLIEAAERLCAAVRENDGVARFGGDEFAVLCEDLIDIRGATEVARRVIRAFEAPFPCGKHEAYVSASIGITFSHSGTETAEAMLQFADAAMYRAKDGGRAKFEVFDDSMQQWIAGRLAIESALRYAIARGELVAFYQPIVAASSRVIKGFEALVRWERPGFGLVPPGTFIGVAEETGMILEIDEWVLRDACRRAVDWATRWPERRLGVSVNISSRQVLKGNIVALVRQVLDTTGLDPTLLTLELTETTLIDDAVSARTVLSALRDLGVNIGLDDFGTGYSSLTYLREFPINVIKIDRSFVHTINTEREGTAIVAAVVSLAKSLNMSVVAEGVETFEQLEAVVDLNCELAQGYLFSRPTPADDIARLVDDESTAPLARDVAGSSGA